MGWQLAAIGGMALAASIIGTAAGFGISTVMIPVLLLWLPLPETLLLVAMIHLAGDLWKMVLFRSGVRWRLVLGFGIAGIATSYLGAWLSRFSGAFPAERVLGAVLLAYVGFLLWRPQWRIRQRPATAVAGGAASGLLAGFFGIGGAVRSAFLAGYDLPKTVYVFTTGIIAGVIDVTRICGYLAGGTRLPAVLWWSLAIAVPLSLVGAAVAKRIVAAVPQGRFRWFVALFLVAIGLRLVILR
jgi:hypothetical protein